MKHYMTATITNYYNLRGYNTHWLMTFDLINSLYIHVNKYCMLLEYFNIISMFRDKNVCYGN